MSFEGRFLRFIQLAAMGIVVVGCYEVLHPFIPAILFAVVVCVSTWPLYLHLRNALGRKSVPAAVLMVLLLVLLVIGPSALLALGLADNVVSMLDNARTSLEYGPIEPPEWLRQTPVFGERLDLYWQQLASGGEESVALAKAMIEPTRKFLLGTGNVIGQSLLQMVFAAFIGFFFYRDGDSFIQTLRDGLTKLAGDVGEELMTTIHHTVAGVVHGIFGTALAQAIVALIGFLIAGVPGAFLLAATTFFLSLIPVGPPLLWGGAAIWLFYQGSPGHAIFMVLWGVFVVSSIDNFVKPYLISRGSHLSLLLIALGVFGGIVSFGFIGIFIGPPILAVGVTLIQLWATHPGLETKLLSPHD